MQDKRQEIMSQEAAYGKTEQCRTGFDVIISVNFLESSKF
ncbi:hypothetical protein HMPREF0971_01734 [Segatella oris F0302]|uniref:Uncharacterized protein n=1 Tax=Segatella oris F0302 TaxID=649760 RepID=D1QRX8_9BACT|nr:hypothetical protein HMPREF0971_01734 [Segatella oris F0302]